MDREIDREPPFPPVPAALLAVFFSFAAAGRRECDRERAAEAP